nr:PREDICTED: coiled-coil domain-containing protein 186-like [Latimeria chalumnae]|eukprot:XP_014349017.1 PREDICTED: coiled-coil domain-containing protein 186-like [Latimeria chalumnae]
MKRKGGYSKILINAMSMSTGNEEAEPLVKMESEECDSETENGNDFLNLENNATSPTEDSCQDSVAKIGENARSEGLNTLVSARYSFESQDMSTTQPDINICAHINYNVLPLESINELDEIDRTENPIPKTKNNQDDCDQEEPAENCVQKEDNVKFLELGERNSVGEKVSDTGETSNVSEDNSSSSATDIHYINAVEDVTRDETEHDEINQQIISKDLISYKTSKEEFVAQTMQSCTFFSPSKDENIFRSLEALETHDQSPSNRQLNQPSDISTTNTSESILAFSITDVNFVKGVQELTVKYAFHQAELNKLTAKLVDSRSRIEVLQQELKSEKEKNETHLNRIKELEGENSCLSEMSPCQNETAEESKQTSSHDLSFKLQEASETANNLKQKVEELEGENTQKQEEVNRLTEEIVESRKSIQVKNKEIANVKALVRKLTEQLEKKDAILQDHRSRGRINGHAQGKSSQKESNQDTSSKVCTVL